MNTKKLSLYAPSVLRIGISLVYLWFGFQQFVDVTQWVGFIPPDILAFSPVDAETLVHLNGAVEIVFGICLLFGFFSRTSALVLALHMADITFMVGYDAIGVRDFGIVIATLASVMFGPDILSLDWYRKSVSSGRAIEEESDLPEKPSSSSQLSPSMVNTHTIDVLVSYIQKEKEKGTPVNSVRDHLFLKGWTTAEIDKAYAILDKKSTGFSDFQA